MKYSRIEDSKVVEIIDFDPINKFHSSLVWLPVPEEFEDVIDDSFIVENDMIVEPEVDYANNIRWNKIRIIRNMKIDSALQDIEMEIQRNGREKRLGNTPTRTDEWLDKLSNDTDLYVQELADIPQKFVTPAEVVFPSKPV